MNIYTLKIYIVVCSVLCYNIMTLRPPASYIHVDHFIVINNSDVV